LWLRIVRTLIRVYLDSDVLHECVQSDFVTIFSWEAMGGRKVI